MKKHDSKRHLSAIFLMVSAGLLNSCVQMTAKQDAAPSSDGSTPATPGAGDTTVVPPSITIQSIEVDVISSPPAIAQMKPSKKDNKLVLRLTTENEAQVVAAVGNDALEQIVWKCTDEDDTPTTVQCGAGVTGNINLTNIIEAAKRRQSSSLKLKVEAFYDTTKLATFEREFFLDSKLSKNGSCLTGTDQEVAIAALVESYATAAASTLTSSTGVFNDVSYKSEGPIFKAVINGSITIKGIRTIRDLRLSQDKHFMVALRTYGRKDHLAADCDRGIRLGNHLQANALAFDTDGNYVSLNKSGNTFSVVSSEVDGSAWAVTQSILLRNFPIRVGLINGVGTSLAAYQAGSFGGHWLNIDPAAVTDVWGP